MKVIIFGATGMVGQAVLRECLRDEAVDSYRVKAAFNPWANRLFEFCRAAARFTWCLFHVFDRRQATRVGCNYLFYWPCGQSCLEGKFEPLGL
jgi:nucleoside-diphosphate-sugar epimerase